MAEPTSTTGAIATGLASGTFGGALLLSLGISWPLLIWGVCGSIPGLIWAPVTSRWHGFFLFIAAALLSAKAGAIGATLWFPAWPDAAGGIAAAAGVVFHPALAVVVTLLPKLIEKRVS